ncbi:MAG: DUF1330 domain-containing protein [Bradyrhizobium sp.]
MPKAYLVVEHIVTDAAVFKEYLTKIGPIIAKHGGRALTKAASLMPGRRGSEAGAGCHRPILRHELLTISNGGCSHT